MATFPLNSLQHSQPLEKLLISAISSPFLNDCNAAHANIKPLRPYKSPYNLISTGIIDSAPNQGQIKGTISIESLSSSSTEQDMTNIGNSSRRDSKCSRACWY